MSDRLRRIAEETAATALGVEKREGRRADGEEFSFPWKLRTILPVSTHYGRREDAEAAAKQSREALAAVILDAIEDALTGCPVPSPVSDTDLAEIATRYEDFVTTMTRTHSCTREQARDWYVNDSEADVADLLRHVEHLHRILHSPEGEAIAAAFDQGRRQGFGEGAAAQREADVRAATPEPGGSSPPRTRAASRRGISACNGTVATGSHPCGTG